MRCPRAVLQSQELDRSAPCLIEGELDTAVFGNDSLEVTHRIFSEPEVGVLRARLS